MSFSVQVTQNVNQAIEQAIAENRLAGVEVVIYHRGHMIYSEARGYSDLETREALQPGGIFRLASVTKTPVTVAALKLVENGKIRLDQPITDFLPYFTPRLADGTQPVITLHHLLTHTSGLSYGFYETDPDSDYKREEVNDGVSLSGLTSEENLKRLAKTRLKFMPGERFNYSLAMDVVGELIRVVDGADELEDVIAKYVTRPLGMSDTSFRVKDKERLVKPYVDAEKPGGPLRPMAEEGVTVVAYHDIYQLHFLPGVSFGNMDYQSGGAGLHGTAEDIAKLLEAIRKGGSPVLRRETTEMMFRDQAKSVVKDAGEGWSFGYGGAVLVDPAAFGVPLPKGIMMWGGVYGHTWLTDRSNELTVVSLSNTAVEGTVGKYPEDLLKAVYEPLIA